MWKRSPPPCPTSRRRGGRELHPRSLCSPQTACSSLEVMGLLASRQERCCRPLHPTGLPRLQPDLGPHSSCTRQCGHTHQRPPSQPGAPPGARDCREGLTHMHRCPAPTASARLSPVPPQGKQQLYILQFSVLLSLYLQLPFNLFGPGLPAKVYCAPTIHLTWGRKAV